MRSDILARTADKGLDELLEDLLSQCTRTGKDNLKQEFDVLRMPSGSTDLLLLNTLKKKAVELYKNSFL